MKADHERALDILKSRDGELIKVITSDGTTYRVWNIAWGYDLGTDVAHITANISPGVEGEEVHFFHANEIVSMVDLESGAVWFESGESS